MNKLIKNCKIAKGTIIYDFVNLYGCTIGKNCKIGPFVEIQKGVVIGDNTTISSHSFVCSKTSIGKGVFVGHGVMFINDKYPPQIEAAWENIIVEDFVSIGSNATILPAKLREKCIIGGGSVVTKDTVKCGVYVGNPARQMPSRFINHVGVEFALR